MKKQNELTHNIPDVTNSNPVQEPTIRRPTQAVDMSSQSCQILRQYIEETGTTSFPAPRYLSKVHNLFQHFVAYVFYNLLLNNLRKVGHDFWIFRFLSSKNSVCSCLFSNYIFCVHADIKSLIPGYLSHNAYSKQVQKSSILIFKLLLKFLNNAL